MNHDESEAEKRYAIWLGDEQGSLVKDDLLGDLDAIYLPGPPESLVALATSHVDALLRRKGKEAVYYDILDASPVGRVLVALDDQGVLAVEIGMSEGEFLKYLHETVGDLVLRSKKVVRPVLEQLREYFQGQRKEFELPLSLDRLTPFQRSVLEATMEVSCGSVTTYAEIARRVGKRRAARAVGQALARNPIPILIPCHRVLGSDGALHGYSGGKGIETKEHLLQLEGALNG